MADENVIDLKSYVKEEPVDRIEISKHTIIFFNGDIRVWTISLEQFPNIEEGEALNINLKAKVQIQVDKP